LGRYQNEALRGTLDLLVLKALALNPNHGWGIGQQIELISGHEMSVNQGSLYPALQRLEQQDLITSEWRESENGRRARYYSLSRDGKAALKEEVAQWKRFSAAIELALSAR
jgi:transcriptional regulator